MVNFGPLLLGVGFRAKQIRALSRIASPTAVCDRPGNQLWKCAAIAFYERPFPSPSENSMISSLSSSFSWFLRLFGPVCWTGLCQTRVCCLGVFPCAGSSAEDRLTGLEERECCHSISWASFKDPSKFCAQPSSSGQDMMGERNRWRVWVSAH